MSHKTETDILGLGSPQRHMSWPQDLLDEETAQRHLSPDQFGLGTVPEGDELDGPLGSYGEPGPVGATYTGVSYGQV